MIACRQATNPDPPLTTAKQWAEHFQVGHLVNDQDLRKIHGWVYEYNSSGQLECVPVESDWMLINDPYITVHWEFVGDPPDLTVPGTYFLKAIFANDSIPDPILCNPCVCPDGTENCEACQECPARKKPTIPDPDIERLFTIWVVEATIHWPQCPIPVQEGGALSNTFITDNGCYRQSRDAVVIGDLGDLANKQLARVEGEISPDVLDPWWEIDEHVGSLDPQGVTSPIHTPPAEPDDGHIHFHAELNESTECPDHVHIVVFPDHLARDLANFHHYRRCSQNNPPEDLEGVPDCSPEGASPGLQLWDNSCVAEISLTCAHSVSHAIFGEKGRWGVNGPAEGDPPPYALLDPDIDLGAKSWQQFQQMQIQRGDVIQVGYATGSSDYPFGNIHVCIAIYNAPGSAVYTHAGDSVTEIFRREHPSNYYYMAWPYWKTKSRYYAHLTSSPQEWVDLYARLRVWRRTSSGG